VNDSWSGSEWLAAFLDRKLDKRERAEVIAYLAAEDDAYEVFACTAVVLREAEGEDADAYCVPYELDRFDVLAGPDTAVLDTLTEEFDALFDRMQTPEADAAMDRAFNASPAELGRAAAAAARRRAR
jgi:hypothetical protein